MVNNFKLVDPLIGEIGEVWKDDTGAGTMVREL